jgi:hypothetical protein
MAWLGWWIAAVLLVLLGITANKVRALEELNGMLEDQLAWAEAEVAAMEDDLEDIIGI